MANTTLKNPNPGDVHADELADLERRAAAPNTDADLAAQDQRDAAMRDSNDSVREQENSGSWANNVSNTIKTKGSKGKSRITGGRWKKTTIGLLLGGGGVAGIIAIVMTLLPLKLEMFAQNITKNATKVAGYAVEERGKALIKRAIVNRIFQAGTGTADGDLLMCKGGGIACSVLKTYTTDFIEKKFDLKFEKNGSTVSIKPTVGNGPGRSWTISSGYDGIDKTLNETELRGYLKKHVDERVSERGIGGWIKRFIGRKILMRKYNVRSWLGEKIAIPGEKLDDLRIKIRTQIIMNIFGRINTRMGVWMLCLQSSPVECEKSISKLTNSQLKSFLGNTDLSKDADKLETKDMQKAVAEAMNKALADIRARLKVAKGWMAAVMFADLAAKILGALSNGTLDRIVSDATLGTYAAFGYGDSSGLFTNIEKLKAGDLDMANIEALSGLLDGAEVSPLMAYENGITNPSIATLFGGTTAYAAGSSSTSGVMCKQRFGLPSTPLPADQLVCDNQKVNQNLLTTQSTAINNSGLGPIANFWNDTLGKVIGFGKDLLGSPNIPDIIDPLGVQGIVLDLINNSPLGEAAMKEFGLFVSSTVINVPDCGVDATGDQNYTCYSGAGWGEANELAYNGQDPTDGTPNGSGGQYLSPQQVAAITKEQDANTPKPSYLASMFDPYTKGSVTQQFALMAPSSGIGLISSLLNTPSAIIAGFGTPSFAASSVSSSTLNNPFSQVMYGYPVGSSAFDADPSNYTAESCKTMAANRVLEHVDGVPYPVYTTSDPCALEKTVVGGLLADAGVTDDPNSLKDPLTSGGSGAATSSGVCPAGMKDEGDSQLADGTSLHLCGIPGTTDPDTSDNIGWVNVDSASQAFDMIKAMQAETGNPTITLTSSFRTLAQQQYLYNCYVTGSCNGGNLAAPPGSSQHETGHAFDFDLGQSGVDNWLWGGGQVNPNRFGYSNHLGTDFIHFSRSGG